MKKALGFGFSLVLLFGFTACGGVSSSAPSSTPVSVAPSESLSDASTADSEVVSTSEPIPHNTPSEAATGQIADFAAALDKAGIEYSEGDSFFTMVGAADGRKFYIGEGAAEVYLFDISSEGYKSALDTGELPVDFEGAAPLAGVVAHKGLVLYCDGLANEEEIISIFKSL